MIAPGSWSMHSSLAVMAAFWLLAAPEPQPLPPQAVTPPDAQELARYRLTPAAFEAFSRASRRLAEAMAADPRFASAPLFTHDLVVAGDVEESSRTIEGRLQADPPLRAALEAARVTPREYTVFAMALVAARLAHGFVKAGVLPGVPAGVAADNVAFVDRHEAAVAAVLALLGIL